MKLRLFILFLMLVTGSTLFAQSIYELDYYFDEGNSRNEYKAFLYFNADGTGFIRIRHFNKADQTDFLVGMEMKEVQVMDKNRQVEKDNIMYTGINSYLVKGQTDSSYSPDRFLFKINPQSGDFEPWGVVAVKKGREYNGVYTQIRLIEMADLNPAFVIQYFTEEDVFYNNLFPQKSRGNDSPKGARLHFISVTNTEDKDIGKTCEIDKRSTLGIFSAVATSLKIPMDTTEVTGMQFSKKNVLHAINSMVTGENDIIIFYYSGHGFSKKNTSYLFPFLDLRINYAVQKVADEEMSIEDIYKMIREKKGKVKLVLSDCCNWGETMKNSIVPNVAGIRGGPSKLNPANCQSLFVKTEPVSFLMTAASKGEVSAGTMAKGGFFTSQFKGAFEKYAGIGNTDEFTWTDILTEAQQLTKSVAEGVSCPQPDNNKIFKPCRQTPLFKMN